jgi:hypothetical protein
MTGFVRPPVAQCPNRHRRSPYQHSRVPSHHPKLVVRSMWATRDLGAPLGGWILSLCTDYTSALSWLQHSACARNPIVHRLSRFLIQMLLQAHFPGKIVSSHIPGGKENDEADCVFRPVSRAPTWASVIEQCCHLRSCTAYRLPLPLLRHFDTA